MIAVFTHILFPIIFMSGSADGQHSPEAVEAGQTNSVESQESAPTADEKKRKELAKKLFAKGQKLFLRDKYGPAIKEFKAAYAEWPYRVIHYNMALTYTFMKEDEKAYHHLTLYLKDATEKEKDLPRELEDLKKRMGVIIVRANNPDATILIDGKEVGSGSVEQVVHTGTREVLIKLAGRNVASKKIEVAGGALEKWSPVLEKSISMEPQKGFARLHWGYFTAAAGITLAAIITSSVLSVRTKSLHDEYMDKRYDANLRSEGIKTKRAAEVMWSITGLLTLGTAAVAIFTEWKQPEESVSIMPAPHNKGAIINITWKR